MLRLTLCEDSGSLDGAIELWQGARINRGRERKESLDKNNANKIYHTLYCEMKKAAKKAD